MYSCSPTLSQILLKNSIGKLFFSNFGHVTIFQEAEILFLAAILKRNIF